MATHRRAMCKTQSLVLANTSVWSPRLLIFITMRKAFFWLNVFQKHFTYFRKQIQNNGKQIQSNLLCCPDPERPRFRPLNSMQPHWRLGFMTLRHRRLECGSTQYPESMSSIVSSSEHVRNSTPKT